MGLGFCTKYGLAAESTVSLQRNEISERGNGKNLGNFFFYEFRGISRWLFSQAVHSSTRIGDSHKRTTLNYATVVFSTRRQTVTSLVHWSLAT